MLEQIIPVILGILIIIIFVATLCIIPLVFVTLFSTNKSNTIVDIEISQNEVEDRAD
jgi:hypothetical protein